MAAATAAEVVVVSVGDDPAVRAIAATVVDALVAHPENSVMVLASAPLGDAASAAAPTAGEVALAAAAAAAAATAPTTGKVALAAPLGDAAMAPPPQLAGTCDGTPRVGPPDTDNGRPEGLVPNLERTSHLERKDEPAETFSINTVRAMMAPARASRALSEADARWVDARVEEIMPAVERQICKTALELNDECTVRLIYGTDVTTPPDWFYVSAKVEQVARGIAARLRRPTRSGAAFRAEAMNQAYGQYTHWVVYVSWAP